MALVSLKAAAKIFQVGEPTVRNAVTHKLLPFVKSEKTYLLDTEAQGVKDYFANYKPKPRSKVATKPGNCPICDKPLSRSRQKFCSRACYGEGYRLGLVTTAEQPTATAENQDTNV